MMYVETIPLVEAERMTGLPSAVIRTLVESGEIPAESYAENLLVCKAALLGWCRLFAKILAVVVSRQSRKEVGGGVSARNLTWMAQQGLLSGKDRIRV